MRGRRHRRRPIVHEVRQDLTHERYRPRTIILSIPQQAEMNHQLLDPEPDFQVAAVEDVRMARALFEEFLHGRFHAEASRRFALNTARRSARERAGGGSGRETNATIPPITSVHFFRPQLQMSQPGERHTVGVRSDGLQGR